MRRKLLFPVLATLTVFFTLACESETEPKKDADTVTTDVTVTDETTPPDESEVAPDEDFAGIPLDTHLVGVWAMKLQLFADATVPVVGDVVTRTDKIIRMTVKKEEEGKVYADWQNAEVCHMETFITEGNDIAKTITTYFPPKFTANFFYVPPTELKEPKEQTTISGDPNDFSFTMNKWYEVRGCYFQGENGTEPFDVETEMITEKNDPRIFDHDDDGRPGHTFEIKSTIANGLIWGALKNFMEITGTGTGNRITGSVLWGEEEVVIGTDQPLFEGERIVTARTTGNTMVMVKIDASKTCEKILKEQDTLFAR